MKFFSGLRHNIRAHNSIAASYDAEHGEIFNPVEQDRLRAKLGEALRLMGHRAEPAHALDFGCGSGNLTAQLLSLGLRVTAADVSEKFLDVVKKRFPGDKRLKLVQLTGKDLSVFKDGLFDFTATYSVLHHIPDYLAAVREMSRVTAKGGIVYIDHEPSQEYWENDPIYSSFLTEAIPQNAAAKPGFSRFFKTATYINRLKRALNPRYSNEGDIHVWPDDHVDWREIEKILVETGCRVLVSENYLLFRRGYREEVYARYRQLCSDEKTMAAIKE